MNVQPQGEDDLLTSLDAFVLNCVHESENASISRPTTLKRLFEIAVGPHTYLQRFSPRAGLCRLSPFTLHPNLFIVQDKQLVDYASTKPEWFKPPTTRLTLAMRRLASDGFLAVNKSSYSITKRGMSKRLALLQGTYRRFRWRSREIMARAWS